VDAGMVKPDDLVNETWTGEGLWTLWWVSGNEWLLLAAGINSAKQERKK